MDELDSEVDQPMDAMQKQIQVGWLVFCLDGVDVRAYDRDDCLRANFDLSNARVDVAMFYNHKEVNLSLDGMELLEISHNGLRRTLVSTAPLVRMDTDQDHGSEASTPHSEESEEENHSNGEASSHSGFVPATHPTVSIDKLYKRPRFLTHRNNRFDAKTAPFLQMWIATIDRTSETEVLRFFGQDHVVVLVNSLTVCISDDSLFELLDNLVMQCLRPTSSLQRRPSLSELSRTGSLSLSSSIRSPPRSPVRPPAREPFRRTRIAVHCWALRFDMARQPRRRVVLDVRKLDTVWTCNPGHVLGKIAFDLISATDPDASAPFQTYLSIVRAPLATNKLIVKYKAGQRCPLSVSGLIQRVRIVYTMRFIDWLSETVDEMTEMAAALSSFRDWSGDGKQSYFEGLKESARASFDPSAPSFPCQLRLSLFDVQATLPGMLPYLKEVVNLERLRRASEDVDSEPTSPASEPLSRATSVVVRCGCLTVQNSPTAFAFVPEQLDSLFAEPIVEQDSFDENAILVLAHSTAAYFIDALALPIVRDGRESIRRRQMRLLDQTNLALRLRLDFRDFDHRQMFVDVMVGQPNVCLSEYSYCAIANVIDEFGYLNYIRRFECWFF